MVIGTNSTLKRTPPIWGAVKKFIHSKQTVQLWSREPAKQLKGVSTQLCSSMAVEQLSCEAVRRTWDKAPLQLTAVLWSSLPALLWPALVCSAPLWWDVSGGSALTRVTQPSVLSRKGKCALWNREALIYTKTNSHPWTQTGLSSCKWGL